MSSLSFLPVPSHEQPHDETDLLKLVDNVCGNRAYDAPLLLASLAAQDAGEMFDNAEMQAAVHAMPKKPALFELLSLGIVRGGRMRQLMNMLSALDGDQLCDMAAIINTYIFDGIGQLQDQGNVEESPHDEKYTSDVEMKWMVRLACHNGFDVELLAGKRTTASRSIILAGHTVFGSNPSDSGAKAVSALRADAREWEIREWEKSQACTQEHARRLGSLELGLVAQHQALTLMACMPDEQVDMYIGHLSGLSPAERGMFPGPRIVQLMNISQPYEREQISRFVSVALMYRTLLMYVMECHI